MNSIKWKMAVMYMLLVVTVMIGQGVLILTNLRSNAYSTAFEKSEYMANRIVDTLGVQSLEPDQGAESIVGAVLTALMVENTAGTQSGSEISIYLLDAEGELLYTRRDTLSSSDLSSRAIITARSGKAMDELYIHRLPGSDVRVGDYALRFTLPQNKTDYILFVRQSLDQVQDDLKSSSLIILTVTLIGIAVAGFLGYLLAVSISSPIQRLTEKTQKLTEETREKQLSQKRTGEDPGEPKSTEVGDELDILEVNFDDMAKELTDSIRDLQGMEQMQKEFVANVSHELRTPVTTIKSYVETLLDSELDNEELTRKFLGIVEHESNRMTALITDLLELSKMDSAQTVPNKHPIEVGRLLREALLDLEWDALKKHQEIRWSEEIPLDEPEDDSNFAWPRGEFWILAENRRIEQVIRNLLTNAIKYSPEGAVIRGGIALSEGEVCVWIRDEGIGISPEDQEKIFTRFYRVDKARSRSMGGTGLGLAIAKETTELYGGRIWVESTLGEGSTFYLAFPEAPEVDKNEEE